MGRFLSEKLSIAFNCTEHSESIQTRWLFPNAITLHPYFKFDSIVFSPSSIYTQYPIMTKQKLKYHIYISIQIGLCWSPFVSNYSLKSSWVWRYKLGTPVFEEFLQFFSADPLKLCHVGWGVLLHSYFFEILFRDVQSGSSPGSG